MPHSATKAPVSREAIESIVDDAFGQGSVIADIVELAEGYFNIIYAITLDDGRSVVLKVAPPPEIPVMTYERNIMAAEVAALDTVATHTSVPTPQVLWSDRSHKHLPRDLFVMERCDGTTLDKLRPTLSPEQQDHLDTGVAGFLGQMNAMSGTHFGLQAPDAQRFNTWRDAFTALVDDVLRDADRAQVALPVSARAVAALIETSSDALDAVEQPSFVHWDLWDGNVVVDPRALEITGVLDFERSLWGDPVMEVQFATKLGDQAFLRAYGEEIATHESARRRRHLYDLYLGLVMIVESTYRRYRNDDIAMIGAVAVDHATRALGR
jgi:aminoglycoside phosphotransferase (APT) family kinase protein